MLVFLGCVLSILISWPMCGLLSIGIIDVIEVMIHDEIWSSIQHPRSVNYTALVIIGPIGLWVMLGFFGLALLEVARGTNYPGMESYPDIDTTGKFTIANPSARVAVVGPLALLYAIPAASYFYWRRRRAQK